MQEREREWEKERAVRHDRACRSSIGSLRPDVARSSCQSPKVPYKARLLLQRVSERALSLSISCTASLSFSLSVALSFCFLCAGVRVSTGSIFVRSLRFSFCFWVVGDFEKLISFASFSFALAPQPSLLHPLWVFITFVFFVCRNKFIFYFRFFTRDLSHCARLSFLICDF